MSPVKSAVSAVVVVLAVIGVLAGCGSSGGSDEASVLKVGISEKGKAAKFSLPGTAESGLVEVKLTNTGKVPHGIQFVRYTGNHNEQDVLKEVASESRKTPDWILAEGGIGSVEPGETGTATLNLEEGNFVIVDTAAVAGPGTGPPASTTMKLSGGETGDLPDTAGEVTAEETGKDKFAWKVSGLKAGKDQFTFHSEGKKALHMIIAVPIKGKAPSLAKIKKDISKEEGPPPPYVDLQHIQSTAVIDGEKSQTVTLNLKKGQYLFFCPLTDRDGGKSHDQEGLIAVENVE